MKQSKLESLKPPSQSNVRLRINTYTNTCTYITHNLLFIEIRSIEMKPIYKPMKCYTRTHTHTHTCPRTYTHPMSKNTVLCARLAPPSNLLAVGVTLPLISQFEFSVNRTEWMRMFWKIFDKKKTTRHSFLREINKLCCKIMSEWGYKQWL